MAEAVSFNSLIVIVSTGIIWNIPSTVLPANALITSVVESFADNTGLSFNGFEEEGDQSSSFEF